MGGLFGGGNAPSVQTIPVYDPAQADLTSSNAALFERIQRSRAYGVNQTQIVPTVSSATGTGGAPGVGAAHGSMGGK